jgi:hypothetical protein
VFTSDGAVTASSLVLVVALVLIGVLALPWVTGVALFVGGAAWTTATVTLNVSTQAALPWWVRARGLGLYLVVLAGGIAIGSAVWGAVAGVSIALAHVLAATVLLAGTLTARRWRLAVVRDLDLRPATPSTPIVNLEPAPDAGPVLVTVAYRVPPDAHEEFADMMRRVERDRRRGGAVEWDLYRDLADTDRFVETFTVCTWGEHLRQHERRTRTADVMLQRAREYVEGDVEVAHFVSAYSESGLAAVEPVEPTLDGAGPVFAQDHPRV